METFIDVLGCLSLILVTFSLALLNVFSIIGFFDYMKEKKHKRMVEDDISKAYKKLYDILLETQKVEEEDDEDEVEVDETVDYKSMTVKDLKKLAQSKGIKGYYEMKKDELIKVLSNM